jgi:hypothetical protein
MGLAGLSLSVMWARYSISGINFEFYALNHQFPDNFKF